MVFFEQKKFPIFSNNDQKIFSLLLKKFRRGCHNSTLRVDSNILKKINFFSKTLYFFSVRDIEWRFFGLLSKTFRPAVTTAFCVSLGTFWWKEKVDNFSFYLVLWDNERTIFSTLSRFSSRGCNNCILPVHRKFSYKKKSSEKFVQLFWQGVENF